MQFWPCKTVDTDTNCNKYKDAAENSTNDPSSRYCTILFSG